VSTRVWLRVGVIVPFLPRQEAHRYGDSSSQLATQRLNVETRSGGFRGDG